MTQLEIVLNGIEEVRNSGIQCPLENVEPHRCFHFPEKLIDDIVSLLKAQEADIQSLSEKYSDLLDRALETHGPRVMTMEEMEKYAKSAGNGMTLEQKPLFLERKPFVKEALNWRTEHEVFNHYCRYEFRIGYGKDFRYWTAQPTEEQRKAVKWE